MRLIASTGNSFLNPRPARAHDHNNGNAALREILLISQVLVSCDEYFEVGSFGFRK
jgi:hypothetical protein